MPKDAPAPKTDDAADKGKDDKPESVTLTQEELEALIETAVGERDKERREKAKAKKAKAKREEPDDDDEDEEEDAAEIISKAEARAAKAEQERDAAKRESLLAKVENKLRDHLALNLREFLNNAPDIMLHIEKALSPDAKDGEIARLIDAHSKAFAERTKAARKPASGAPIGGARRTSGLPVNDDPEQRRTVTPKPDAAPTRAFSTINWHG